MKDDHPASRAVPSRRLSRLGQFGRLAGGVAGGMLAEGARRLATGERPSMRDMLLTPGNAARVADRRFLGVIREQVATLGMDRAAWHIPPADTLFVQRKISGTALLAARLGAHVDIRAKVAAHLAEWSG